MIFKPIEWLQQYGHRVKVTQLPDVFMSVHVHGVKLLHLLLTGLLLHVLEHLVSDVLGKDGEQQAFLLDRIRHCYSYSCKLRCLLFIVYRC